jgi:alpha-glucosidase
MLKLRQRLIPHLYTLFEECHRTGAPIFRPLLFEYPDDHATYTLDDEFLLGSALLIAPITRPGIEHRHVYLPEGIWFHFWTGERYEGPTHILAHAPLGEPAICLRANTALPLWPDMNYVGEKPADPLTLLLYPTEGAGESVLYEDAGNGFNYMRGEYARRSVKCEVSGASIFVRLSERQSFFVPERGSVYLAFRGVSAPETVSANGEKADWHYKGFDRELMVSLKETADEVAVEVHV